MDRPFRISVMTGKKKVTNEVAIIIKALITSMKELAKIFSNASGGLIAINIYHESNSSVYQAHCRISVSSCEVEENLLAGVFLEIFMNCLNMKKFQDGFDSVYEKTMKKVNVIVGAEISDIYAGEIHESLQKLCSVMASYANFKINIIPGWSPSYNFPEVKDTQKQACLGENIKLFKDVVNIESIKKDEEIFLKIELAKNKSIKITPFLLSTGSRCEVSGEAYEKIASWIRKYIPIGMTANVVSTAGKLPLIKDIDLD